MLLLSLTLLSASTSGAQTPKADAVLVYKSERLLMLLRAGEIIGHYKIALGKNPIGPKTLRGRRAYARRSLLPRLAQPGQSVLPLDTHLLPGSERPRALASLRRLARRQRHDPWLAQRSEPGATRVG